MRGLKLTTRIVIESNPSRTLTGAWIETARLCCYPVPTGVAPSRVRGLKPPLPGIVRPRSAVAPSRVRGLKPSAILPSGLPIRRTLTGAWIETNMARCPGCPRPVAPSRVRGLKFKKGFQDQKAGQPHPHGMY
ncbi:hypothetical protein HMPREF3038_02708 [Akkermansia sp. KLE1797]|nr:hypothetical protein HMPREF3038_02708 [Akkermansia sp. KLE1797]